MAIPPTTSLCGLELHAQGLCQTCAAPVWKTRAARYTLTNALDLLLGF